MNEATIVKHPARYNDAILSVIDAALSEHVIDGTVVDPFGGVGGIHKLHGYNTLAIELEPEWAEQAALLGPTWCGDFFDWEPHSKVGAVVTSCTYGNRMADNHQPGEDDKSTRITYRHSLGRELDERNSGGMQWGVEYRAFHIRAWIKVRELLTGGGIFVLNVKDHVRKGEIVPVVDWHRKRVLGTGGFELLDDVQVPVTGMGFGANGQVRVAHEHVMTFERVRDQSKWNIEGQARREAKRDAGGTRHVG
jgi:hypothetical protein